MSDHELQNTIKGLIAREGLPAAYEATVATTILPLLDHILSLREQKGRPVIVGIHGAQGTGKSTLTQFLRELLQTHWQCPTASLSLDDLYLTRAERLALSRTVHPLLKTRGVPGTHDLALGHQVLDQLLTAGPGDATPIPAFDKALDDRVPEVQWPVLEGAAHVILLEGWCVGATPQSEEDLARAVNRLEAKEDADGQWRRYVNDCLKSSYRVFFDRLDALVMLKAPSMDCVLEWRRLQEHKLAQRYRDASKWCGEGVAAQSLRIMSDTEVHRFIMHYQRVTEHCLQTLPARADVLIPVGADHFMEVPIWRDQI